MSTLTKPLWIKTSFSCQWWKFGLFFSWPVKMHNKPYYGNIHMLGELTIYKQLYINKNHWLNCITPHFLFDKIYIYNDLSCYTVCKSLFSIILLKPQQLHLLGWCTIIIIAIADVSYWCVYKLLPFHSCCAISQEMQRNKNLESWVLCNRQWQNTKHSGACLWWTCALS